MYKVVIGFEYAPHLLYTSLKKGNNFVFLDTQIEFMQIIVFNFNSHSHLKRDHCKKYNLNFECAILQRHFRRQTTKRKGKILSLMRFKKKKKERKKIIIIPPRWVNFKMAAGRNWNATSAYFPPLERMIFLNVFRRDGRKLRGKILSGMAPSTAFQQQIKDFKPKVISPGEQGVTPWKRGDGESAFIVFPIIPRENVHKFLLLGRKKEAGRDDFALRTD